MLGRLRIMKYGDDVAGVRCADTPGVADPGHGVVHGDEAADGAGGRGAGGFRTGSAGGIAPHLRLCDAGDGGAVGERLDAGGLLLGDVGCVEARRRGGWAVAGCGAGRRGCCGGRGAFGGDGRAGPGSGGGLAGWGFCGLSSGDLGKA